MSLSVAPRANDNDTQITQMEDVLPTPEPASRATTSRRSSWYDDDPSGEENLTNVASIEPTPPDGGYGWVVAVGLFLVNTHTWGIASAWAIIMAYYLRTHQIEGSHLEFGIIGGLAISQALMVSPLVGTIRKYLGSRPTSLVGCVLIFVALLTSSFATQVWQLFLTQGFCFGWGMGLCYVTASQLLPPWFTKNRSLAVGLATSGTGIGGLIYSLAAHSILQSLGIEWTWRILAFCSLAGNGVAALLMREWGGRSHATEEFKFNPRDFGRVELLLIILWGVSTELGYIILLYSLPVYANSIGLSAQQGTVANALFNVGLAVGRPFLGWFSDVFGRINVAGLTALLTSIFCFALWMPSTSYASLLAFALLAGMLCGTFWAAVTPILAEVVGIRKLTSTIGVVMIAMVAPATFAEPIAFAMAGETSSFTSAQLFVSFMFLLGSLTLWCLRSWKIFVDAEAEASRTNSVRRSVKKHNWWVSWLTPRLLFSFGRV